MKTLIGAIILVVTITIGYPLLNEGPSNVCSALEMRLITLESRKSGNLATAAFLAALQGSLSNGSLAMSIVKQQHPDLPPIVGCTLTYWQTIFNPPGEEKRTIQDDAQRALERAKEAQKAMRDRK